MAYVRPNAYAKNNIEQEGIHVQIEERRTTPLGHTIDPGRVLEEVILDFEHALKLYRTLYVSDTQLTYDHNQLIDGDGLFWDSKRSCLRLNGAHDFLVGSEMLDHFHKELGIALISDREKAMNREKNRAKPPSWLKTEQTVTKVIVTLTDGREVEICGGEDANRLFAGACLVQGRPLNTTLT